MVLSTTVLEPKRNPRNVPRKGLGSGPRIPSKPLNPGQRSREITKRLYGRGQSQRSCHPGPEENRSREHLSSIQRTPGLQCLSSTEQNTREENSDPVQPSVCHHGAHMVNNKEGCWDSCHSPWAGHSLLPCRKTRFSLAQYLALCFPVPDTFSSSHSQAVARQLGMV